MGEDVNRRDIRAFYARRSVRKRIGEYLGAEDSRPASAVYLAQPDLGWPRTEGIYPPDSLASLLEGGGDLSRSLWDRRSLIAHLDIEYVNFEFQHEAYIHPARSFRLQESVRAAGERILSQYGIDVLHLVTGRGHHYVWRINRESNVFKQLQRLGRCNRTLLNRYCAHGLSIGESVPASEGLAFSGLGRLMEYLAARIKTEAASAAAVPVELTAVAVGPGERGREMVSIDISEYGDPLYLRVIRVPFTAYLKQGIESYSQMGPGNGTILTMVAPEDVAVEPVLRAARDVETAGRLAETTSARIPEAASGTEQLMRAYADSALRTFHDRFYVQSQHPPQMWTSTYDMTPLDLLPPCAARILEDPNDLLMRPAAIELIVRTMLGFGWHPRHIAGLIRSKYERDHGWGNQWLLYDAATRADFYTRIFAGTFACGVDDLVDFNCTSVREKGLCVPSCNGCALDSLRHSLLERRHHGRLAHRPFNRLFLPDKHL